MAKDITSEQFEAEVLKSDKPVVIDFYAEWCGPCQQMAPHFEALSQEKGDYSFVKINIDNERELAIAHGIASIPTLVFYKNGEKVGVESGYHDKDELAVKLGKYFS